MLVGLVLLLRPLPAPAVVKLAVLAPAAVLLSFALAAVLLTAPVVSRVP